ncbi:hypothetical protein [Alkaliphilus sp. B6464]|uniref:hypothetical protein n=1 Tax=Alkaliphilus sp. B6464 TaxID=2731219 RepID=UPI001BA59504|nr:hypothetical protein [Alkaliphilus sp. B6464]QUH22139.1 hypothetical protein HYG84_19725 [Alkaliphilus sp. B6464]
MMLSTEQLIKINKLNLGKVIYTLEKISNDSGIITETRIGQCLGTIEKIGSDGTCTLYNKISKEQTTINIFDFNKNLNNFCLRKKYL